MSKMQPDWSREALKPGEWDPGKRLLASIRAYQRYRHQAGITSSVLKKWAVLRHRFWSIFSGADIPLNCQIEGGLRLPHPNGIVIHPGAKIGPNCLIFQQVTLGARSSGSGAPIIAANVDISAGAKILGSIHIGERAIIGANAVVLKDVPAGATAVGIPARVVEKQVD